MLFLLKPVPFNRQNYQKQKQPGTSDQSLFRLWKKFRKIPLSPKKSSSWVILKFISANLCKSIYDIINYSTSICPFESGKSGKERKKLQKFEYLENEKSFFNEIKNTFHRFWRPIIWWKNKNLIKSSGHKL